MLSCINVKVSVTLDSGNCWTKWHSGRFVYVPPSFAISGSKEIVLYTPITLFFFFFVFGFVTYLLVQFTNKTCPHPNEAWFDCIMDKLNRMRRYSIMNETAQVELACRLGDPEIFFKYHFYDVPRDVMTKACFPLA